MSRVVIDASVAAKWFLRETLHEDARRLIAPEVERVAPDWIVQEVAHVAFKRWREGEIGAGQAITMVRTLPEFFAELYSSFGLIDRAFDIALTIDHPVYDCLYLACAEAADGILVTADKSFCTTVGNSEFAALVEFLGDSAFLQKSP